MIPCPECAEPFTPPACSCGYTAQRVSEIVFRSTEHEIAEGITKEEFGLDLFRAIHCIGSILQLRQYRGKVAMGDLTPNDDYLAREHKLINELRPLLVTLNVEHVADLVTRYPWIATL